MKTWAHLQPKMNALVKTWAGPVYELLEKLAYTSWPACQEKPRRLNIYVRWVFRSKDGPPCLYWEVYYTAMWVKEWYSVTLTIDEDCEPQNFDIECGGANNTLRAGLDLEKLKRLLDLAASIGPVSDLKREPAPGIDINYSYPQT